MAFPTRDNRPNRPTFTNRTSASQPVTPTTPNKLKPKFKTFKITENIPDSPRPARAGFFPTKKITKTSKYSGKTLKHLSLRECRETSYSKENPFANQEEEDQSLQHSLFGTEDTDAGNASQNTYPKHRHPHNPTSTARSSLVSTDEEVNEDNNNGRFKLRNIGVRIKTQLTRTRARSNSNTILMPFNKLRHNKSPYTSPGTNSQRLRTDLVGHSVDTSSNSVKSSTTNSIPLRQRARLLLNKTRGSDAPTAARPKTTKEGNKKFIFERLQQDAAQPALYRSYQQPGAAGDIHAASTVGSGQFSLDETEYHMITERPIDYNYPHIAGVKSKKASLASTMTHKTYQHSSQNETSSLNSRKQLVYIGGIDERNCNDVKERLFDLFEMWGDSPNILWNNDCLYVRFPSIKSAIDGINVFDGEQPNGYSLCAELVLEGSQMVFIDGLDGDWNEDIFKAFVDVNTEYKVFIKRHEGDKAYAFVQFCSLEAVQSAIDTFDAETEIDGKLVRWEHMVKAYVGKIGGDQTVQEIQNELSEFDPSYKHLPIEIRKSREPIYYGHNESVPTSLTSAAAMTDLDITDKAPTQPQKIISNARPSDALRLVISPKSDTNSSNALDVTESVPPAKTTLSLNVMEESKEQVVHRNPQTPIIYETTRKQSVEEQKSATPMAMSQPTLGLFELSRYEPLADVPTLHSQSYGKEISAGSSNINTPQPGSPKFSIVSSKSGTTQSIGNESMGTTECAYNYEYEWHYYAYIWFPNKYDAMRAQTRFDQRNCFGSNDAPIRFLLMNDMTQKVYVSGLMKGCTNKDSIERDINRGISDTDLWRKQCIITYIRNNEERPFAYIRFPSLETTNEAIRLFDNKICFGNKGDQRIHLELVKETTDLLCRHIGRSWDMCRYCYLSLSFVFLPICLTCQWLKLCLRRTSNENGLSATTKDLAETDLLRALFYFSPSMKQALASSGCLYRWPLIVVSYALYLVFYLLFTTYDGSLTFTHFTALLPIILYLIITQWFCCWCAVDCEVAYPHFHVLEHVSMYFEDSVVYSRLHVTASDFAASKKWNVIIYPWHYPIEWNKRMMIPALVYPFVSRYGMSPFEVSVNDLNTWIELLAFVLMFGFCFILFCIFSTITSRIYDYYIEVLHLTELITLQSNLYDAAFLKLDSENNLFAWLSLRSFIHRKGCVVFCGLEIHSLFLVLIVVLNLVFIIVGIFQDVAFRIIVQNRLIFCQSWFLVVSLYYLSYVLMIGYWFGKENQNQLNRVERHKLFIYTERMKQVLNQEKYKLVDNTKIIHLKLLLNSMEALVQHVQTKEITPRLWGIRLNDFSGKVALTVVAAVIPSVLVRWLLNVS